MSFGLIGRAAIAVDDVARFLPPLKKGGRGDLLLARKANPPQSPFSKGGRKAGASFSKKAGRQAGDENSLAEEVGGGANLVTERKFTDFKLHVELRLPAGSNSGVYLRGRYEVQIADPSGEPASDGLGAVYGFIAPSEDAGKSENEWQSLDITLVGRRITVVVNGKTVICDQEIPGITGGALDSDEAAPGPLLLQGDHGPVEFRNLILTPAS